MRLLFLIFPLLCFSSFLCAQNATQSDQETRYISDELFIFMHSGPGRNFRIVGSIDSGAAVSLLQINSEAGFAQVQDETDRTGWVEIEFLSVNPSIRLSLQTTESELNALQKEASAMRKKMDAALIDFEEADTQNASLNQKLTKTLEQNVKLERRLANQDKTEQMQWFTRGGILALISVFVGYLLGLYARKKNRSNRIM